MHGVILYGPPAAGKDTVTKALADIDTRYSLFRRLKAGPGKTEGYRMTTDEQLDRLRSEGQLIWENRRYGARYAVDQDGLLRALEAGRPVLHLGQVQAVDAVVNATRQARASWVIAYLWCPRPVALARLRERAATDIPSRLAAWDETQRLRGGDVRIDTSRTATEDAARAIHELVPLLGG